VARFETEVSDITFAGINSRQDMHRLLLGYAFPVDANTFTLFAGPTYVDRDLNGVNAISETGYYLGVEGYGFFGDQGFWAGIAQFSSPDDEFYVRGFTTYLVSENLSLGPDVSYLHEPDYERTTLGLRASWVIDDTVLGVIGGVSMQDGTAGPSESAGFLELQASFSF